MKVLFAVSNEDISESIVKKYQQEYKEIIVGKNVYYFNAILKELQKDKSYDRIVISEELEPFTNNNYETIDNFIFEKLDNISDEAVTNDGEDIPIILIATDRRTKTDNLLSKLFGIGVYSTLIGQDRSIEKVCELINKPRLKKEAKLYYKIDSNEVEYKPENNDVSETEIQNILIHYKRLGKNEDRYVESFENIAAQYTDEQLKVIIKFLPFNVKAVLEEKSLRYQQLVSFGNGNKKNKSNKYQTQYTSNMKNNITKAVDNSGITVESIPNQEKKITKPVIIPSVNNVKRVENTKKIEQVQEKVIKKLETIEDEENLVETENLEFMEQTQPKRGRGRPRKIKEEAEQEKVKEVKRRGRPRKNQPIIEEQEDYNENDEEDILPGFEDYDEEKSIIEENNYYDVEQEDYNENDEEDMLPGFEADEEYEEQEDDEILPRFENIKSNQVDDNEYEYEEYEENLNLEDNKEQEDDEILPGFEDIKNYNDENEDYDFSKIEPAEKFGEENFEYEEQEVEENYKDTNIDYYNKQDYEVNLENLITKDKKIVSFVGTSKNGTSFIVNNLAEILSKQGIKTAILDLTKNRNSYYIYTKNEEELRKIACSSITKLIQENANGIHINNYLDVYTALPGENVGIEQCLKILETLLKNYSLILLDCDFQTPYEYIKQSQETYLVQSMDVLTIQPITAYLRELKAKGALEQNKLRVIINKYVKVKSVTEKAILGGMAFYNDPTMSYMTELFNREIIPYCTIPFDIQVYTKYLEGLINCDVTVNGYPKEILQSLKKLASTVYPLIESNNWDSKEKYKNPKYNKYVNQDNFTDQMNSTINKMKNNY